MVDFIISDDGDFVYICEISSSDISGCTIYNGSSCYWMISNNQHENFFNELGVVCVTS